MKTARFLDVDPVEGREASAYGIQLPAPKDEAHKKWRDEWLQQITRSRDLDRLFKELLAKDRVFTCENYDLAEPAKRSARF